MEYADQLHDPVRECQRKIGSERTRAAVLCECEKLRSKVIATCAGQEFKLEEWLRQLNSVNYDRFSDESWYQLTDWIGGLLDPPTFSGQVPEMLRETSNAGVRPAD